MGADTYLLVHSPFVGPYTWKPAADHLERLGYLTLTPTLQPVLDKRSGFAQGFADCVARSTSQLEPGTRLHLVVHSAAGFFLPAFIRAIEAPIHSWIFVDARIPAPNQSLMENSPPAFTERLAGLARRDTLPPWSQWFGDRVIEELIPDPAVRKRFLAELRPIPAALLHEKLAVDDRWQVAHITYIRLSPSYQAEADAARSMDWKVAEMNGNHFQMLVDPVGVVELILAVTPRLRD